MTNFFWKYILPLFVGVLFVGCKSSPGSGSVTITKVNPYHLNAEARKVTTVDPMVRFEPRRHLRGAVTAEEIKERYGHYYTIFWKSKTKSPAVVRFEYRQGSTGSQILSREVSVESPKRENTTKFQITGSEYHTGGPITQWKVTVWEGGTKMAEYKSYLWKE